MAVRKHLVDKNFLKTSIIYRTTKNKRKMIKEKKYTQSYIDDLVV